MSKLMSAIVFASLVFIPHSAIVYDHSIRPLSAHIQPRDMFGMTDPDEQPMLRNICTAWAYNSPSAPTHTEWVTAGHCVVDTETGKLEDMDYQIDGHLMHVDRVLWPQDIAALSGDNYNTTGLTIGDHFPQVYDPQQPIANSLVVSRGYPFGFSQLFTTQGTVVAIGFTFPDDEDNSVYDIYQMPVAGGNSGSPIFNSHNQVVSMVQIGFGSGYGSISGGIQLTLLKSFLNSL